MIAISRLGTERELWLTVNQPMPPGLNANADRVADRAPERESPARNRHGHFIEMLARR
jgi:hypothetical protein